MSKRRKRTSAVKTAKMRKLSLSSWMKKKDKIISETFGRKLSQRVREVQAFLDYSMTLLERSISLVFQEASKKSSMKKILLNTFLGKHQDSKYSGT